MSDKSKESVDGLKLWLIIMGIGIGIAVLTTTIFALIFKFGDGFSLVDVLPSRLTPADETAKQNITEVETALIEYQTNNRGRLPNLSRTCDEVACEEYVFGGNTQAGKFYTNYGIGDLRDYYGSKITLNFYGGIDIADEEDLATDPQTMIKIFYNATCDDDKLVTANSLRRFAVVAARSDESGYFCY